jgi:hypothetical protein
MLTLSGSCAGDVAATRRVIIFANEWGEPPVGAMAVERTTPGKIRKLSKRRKMMRLLSVVLAGSVGPRAGDLMIVAGRA